MSPPVVIVGAGSSGCVLANRLSEGGQREVILLEAGPDYAGAALPADLTDGTRNSMHAHDWTYRHKPSASAVWSPLPRGKVVGGSSAVNTCIALRGQPEDYDEWAALGLSEWDFDACLPAFKKLEHDLDFSDDFHGTSGPIPIRRHKKDELVPFQSAFLDACSELGLPPCADSNAPGRTGYGPHAMNKVGGRRVSAAEAYLTPEVRARRNLRIVPNTLVRRVLFETRRTTGLELEGPRGVERLDAADVVLSAGAINTPGILLRSGVGPDAEVRRLACEPVLDAPAVGRRLLDHPGTGVFVLARRGVTVDRRAPIVQTVFRYSSGLCNNPADMFLQPVSFTMILKGFPLFALVSMVGKPRGHGSLHYPDAKPTTVPVIESRFFENAQDRKLAADSLARCRELLATRALSRMGRPLYPFSLFGSDRALQRAVRIFCDSGYHPCGTVPMGTTPGEHAAVDAHGRVFGLEGLHVVDASVMPTIPSSNIHLPTLMIAERMATFLRERL
ncbi:MAG TPA: GMC family oxidoreductase N-terminal domain-containing protein [Polyangiaceae bacterium]|jgi:choline dehydrogenase|nr:GMC family oxidoreductase N-terminal domain-containing protein [Polyangiaceae bacterium]